MSGLMERARINPQTSCWKIKEPSIGKASKAERGNTWEVTLKGARVESQGSSAMRCLRVLWLGVRRFSGVLAEARRRGGQNVEF